MSAIGRDGNLSIVSKAFPDARPLGKTQSETNLSTHFAQLMKEDPRMSSDPATAGDILPARYKDRPIEDHGTPNNLVRVDGRKPEVIFKEGFQPRSQSNHADSTLERLHDYAKNNTWSNVVSTAKGNANLQDFSDPGNYIYKISTDKRAVNVNANLLVHSPYPHERESSIVGGVPPEHIQSAQRVGQDGNPEGEPILNPRYKSLEHSPIRQERK